MREVCYIFVQGIYIYDTLKDRYFLVCVGGEGVYYYTKDVKARDKCVWKVRGCMLFLNRCTPTIWGLSSKNLTKISTYLTMIHLLV